MRSKSLLNSCLLICIFVLLLDSPVFAYVWPLSNSSDDFADVATSPFGPRDRNPDPNAFNYDFHGGLDLNAAVGWPIHAIAGHGEVRITEFDEVKGYYLAIYHGGVWSEYFHLKEGGFNVSEGDAVGEGQLIGWSGATGSVTGAHLHLGYRMWDPGYEDSDAQNPLDILPYNNGSCPKIINKQAFPANGSIDSFWVEVQTPHNELDFNEIKIWFYHDTQARSYTIDFNANWKCLDNETGELVYCEGDPIFETVVKLRPYDFNALSPQKMRISVDPANNVFPFFSSDSIESMGIELADLAGERPEDNPCSERDAWGNVSGTPLIPPLESFAAFALEKEIEVMWTLGACSQAAAINLYRSEVKEGDFVKINHEPIRHRASHRSGQTDYSFIDTNTLPAVEYFYKLERVLEDGRGEFFPEIVSAMIISAFALNQNYPNPFNLSTMVSYDIDSKKPVHTSLTIYNILGQKVKAVVDQQKSAGRYKVEWDGTDEKGHSVSSGLYFYVLKADKSIDKKKMLLLK